ncbi:MAG TPA: L,D-transpeptidase [Sporichthyaceae bacterium]|nr:L,D-transpeptidase [Sporichthyaceae bacterium]
MAGTSILVGAGTASAMPSQCNHGTVICINQGSRTLRLMINGRNNMTMSARFGARRTPTHYGTYRVYWKDLHHVSSLYGSAMPFSLFFDRGQAVHFSSDFVRNGYSGASHGCVNLRSYSGARDLFYSVGVGTRVVVY